MISMIKKGRTFFKAELRIMYFAIMLILLLPNLSKAQVTNWNDELEQGCMKFGCGDWEKAFSHS